MKRLFFPHEEPEAPRLTHPMWYACVHDRLRPGVSLGVWLTDDPLSLGPMGCVAERMGTDAVGADMQDVS